MSSSCFEIQRAKTWVEAVAAETEKNGGFRERMTFFSLDFREIQPSEFAGTRSKTVLRSEGFAWVPHLRSFDKLREVGVSSYLSFTLCLSVFTMFELIEAVSDHLIGPKTWDRNVRIFFSPLYAVHGS